MIIYGSTFSPFVRKLVAYCNERGLEFDLHPVGIQDPDPAFRAASPLGKMPAITDGDYGLADSSAIIHYLEAKYPDGRLFPADPQALGQAIFWEEYADTVLFACGGRMFFNRIVAPLFLKRGGDQAVADAAEREELPPILSFLDQRVPDAGAFLVGDRLTVADLAVASPFINLDHCGVKVTGDNYPRLAAWLPGIIERESFAASIARERGFLAKARETA